MDGKKCKISGLTEYFCFQRIGTGYPSVSRRIPATRAEGSTGGWYRCNGTRGSSAARRPNSSVSFATLNSSISTVCWGIITCTWPTWRERPPPSWSARRGRLDLSHHSWGLGCVGRDATAVDHAGSPRRFFGYTFGYLNPIISIIHRLEFDSIQPCLFFLFFFFFLPPIRRFRCSCSRFACVSMYFFIDRGKGASR